LLIGDIGGGRRNLLEAYAQMHQADTVAHQEVVEFVRERRLFGRGVGWIDVNILASAVVGGFQMWTADRLLSSGCTSRLVIGRLTPLLVRSTLEHS
jgi:hypothetical protein